MKKLKFIVPPVLLALVIILTIIFSVPKKEVSFIYTDIDYAEGKFNAVYNDYAVYSAEEKTQIFKINRKKAEISEYFSFDTTNELIDANDEKLLLKDKKGYFVFYIKSKKTTRFSTKDIPLNNEFNNITCKFSKKGDKLIVTKVLTDKNKPMKVGKVLLGYELKENSGVYVYSVSSGKKIAETHIDKLGVTETKKLEFSISFIDDKNIGLILYESAIGTSFFNEHYYSLSINGDKIDKIGSYSNYENIDVFNKKFKFNSYYVNMNSTTVCVVDFARGTQLKTDSPTVQFYENSIVYLMNDSNSFVISKPSGLGYWECVIKNGNISFEEFEVAQFEKYYFEVSKTDIGTRIELSKELLEKFEDKKVDGVYKTFSENCYLAKIDNKFCIIYK